MKQNYDPRCNPPKVSRKGLQGIFGETLPSPMYARWIWSYLTDTRLAENLTQSGTSFPQRSIVQGATSAPSIPPLVSFGGSPAKR